MSTAKLPSDCDESRVYSGVIVEKHGGDHRVKTMFLFSKEVERGDGLLVCSQDFTKYAVGEWIRFHCDRNKNYFGGHGKCDVPVLPTKVSKFGVVELTVRVVIYRGVKPCSKGWLLWSPDVNYVFGSTDEVQKFDDGRVYMVEVAFAVSKPSFYVNGKPVDVHWEINSKSSRVAADQTVLKRTPFYASHVDVNCKGSQGNVDALRHPSSVVVHESVFNEAFKSPNVTPFATPGANLKLFVNAKTQGEKYVTVTPATSKFNGHLNTVTVGGVLSKQFHRNANRLGGGPKFAMKAYSAPEIYRRAVGAIEPDSSFHNYPRVATNAIPKYDDKTYGTP